jgi:hypothetical protein
MMQQELGLGLCLETNFRRSSSPEGGRDHRIRLRAPLQPKGLYDPDAQISIELRDATMNGTTGWKKFFSITLPNGWSNETDEDLISVFKEDDGVGALQISFALRSELNEPSSREAMELAKQFAEQQGWEVPESSIVSRVIGLAPASELSLIDSSTARFWRVWHLVSLKRVALVTYSCDLEEAEVEKQACDAMMESFRWLPARSGD